MSKSTTDRVQCSYSVKEDVVDPSGPPWIAIETDLTPLGLQTSSFLSIELVPGTTLKEAEELEDLLNRLSRGIAYTRYGIG